LEALEISQATSIQYQQILSSLVLAVAQYLNGDYGDCEEQMANSLNWARTADGPLEFQAWFLAVYADSCMARGDAQAAISKAREAIVAADAGVAWFQGALARTVLADALIQAGAPDAAARAVVAEAHELVRKSGGNSLLPRLREAEARLAGRNDHVALQAGLREAEAMYRAMGAPDPAERLAQEIGC
jgi:ATP/maltotriose-dependent transcriptional regulator MalT